MTVKKKLLATAVGGALTLGIGLPAHAGDVVNMLFPYVVKETGRTTIITIIGKGQPINQGPELHLQYWTKSTTAANTAACEPSSTTLTFTDNDIVSFDTAGIISPGPLFGDTTNNAPLGTSISYAGPRHGYLAVSSPDTNDSGDTEVIYAGYWVEIDLTNGGAHGGIGIQGFDGNGNYSSFPVSLWQSLWPGRGWFGFGGAAHAVTFWPASVASTVFTVTPTGTNMLTNDNNQVVMQVLNAINYGIDGVQGAYDRNENGIDGTIPQTVRCVGKLTAAQLMPGVVSNAAWAATGGWGFLTNLGNGNANLTESCGANSLDCPAIVYQVDTSNAAGTGKFMSNATSIATFDF